MWGFHLWANLPRAHKMMDPHYQEVTSAKIPVAKTVDGATIRIICGKPLKEPVAWYGPIVMNTHEELRTAFKEFEAGTFIKRKETIRAT